MAHEFVLESQSFFRRSTTTRRSSSYRQPSAGATCTRIDSITCALYSTPSVLGTVRSSVSASAIASSAFSCFDQYVRLGRVRSTEHRSHVVEDSDLIVAFVAAEVGAVAIVHQREDRSRYRHPRRARVPGVGPRLSEGAYLARLLDMKRLARFVRLERGALQVHAVFRGPNGRRVRR